METISSLMNEFQISGLTASPGTIIDYFTFNDPVFRVEYSHVISNLPLEGVSDRFASDFLFSSFEWVTESTEFSNGIVIRHRL